MYDAHEYFTEMEEIVSRPAIKKAWQAVERFAVPKIKHAYTVSDGYARMFREQYGVDFKVVRNATLLNGTHIPEKPGEYILYQGAVNVGRGLEALIEAMPQVDMPLYICGKGDVFDELQAHVKRLNLQDKVHFKGYVPPDQLRNYTLNARIGITLFSSHGLHHQYSLANRFFDYMHAGVPQIATNFPEYANFNKECEVAVLVDELSPQAVAEGINKLLNNPELYQHIRSECMRARQTNNWQGEEEKLIALYRSIGAPA